MRWVVYLLIALAILVIVWTMIVLIGHYTIGFERIIYHIGCLAIGVWGAKITWRITDKIKIDMNKFKVDDINEDYYVSYETAVDLRHYGFDLLCDHYYKDTTYFSYAKQYYNWNRDTGYYSAPTLAQTLIWLRKTYGIYVEVIVYFDERCRVVGKLAKPLCNGFNGVVYLFELDSYPNYESALVAGINEALTKLNELPKSADWISVHCPRP